MMKPRPFRIAQVIAIRLSHARDSSTVRPLREKVHHQKRDGRGDDGGDGGDEKNLLIDVLHDLRCLFPDRRGRSRLDQKRQDADAEPCGIEPAPRTFPRRRKLRQIVGCVQRCSSFSFPDAKSRRPIRASARNKIQFLYAFEHLQYSISGFAPKEQKRANVMTMPCRINAEVFV